MAGKNWILILFLFLGFKGLAQSISYTYTDPCTGIPNTVSVSSASGTVVMFYAGQYQTFTMSQLQAGGYEAWVASINAAAPPGSNPCAGNAGAVAGSTSASVGTNVTNTVTNITGALSVLGGGNLTSSSGGMSVGGGTTGGSSSSSSSSSNSNDNGNDQGNDNTSSDSGSNTGSSSSGSSSSNGNSSGDSGNNSGSSSSSTGGDTGSGSGSGGNTGGNSGGDTGGNSGGNTGGNSGGDTGGSSGGSTGGTGGGSTEGGQDGTGTSVDTGGGDDSNSGGAIGEQSIESSSGGESESDSGGSSGGKKKNGPRARKGSLIASGDMVVIRNGSDYKATGNDNFKINMGATYANTTQTLAAGALLNYTTGQNEFSLTGYGSWKIEESMLVGSNSFLYNVKQQTWFNTGNIMYAFKQTRYTTILFGTNFSIGRLGEENFSNWSAQTGVFTTFNGWKGYSINLMGIGMYSPYTFFYEGQWFKGGFLLVPLTSIDMAVTDTFKFNISTSTVMLQGQGILNFQLMTGGKMLL